MARQMKDSGIEWIGEIPECWERTKLLNLLRQSICDGPHETPNLVDEGIPFISIDSLNTSEYIDFTKCKKFISEDDYLRYYEKANIEEGDVLFTKAATIGKTAIVGKERFMVWSPIAIIKANEQIAYNKYVYHLLNCFELIKYISMLGSYNTQINVGMRELEQAVVPFPYLAEQQRIAAFLDRKCAEIDAVIERTKATIEEYRKLKQAVITEAVTKGVRGPRKMKDSGAQWIGSIPEAWKVYRIANLYDERSEEGSEELPILTVSINTGVSDHEVADEDKERVFVRIEDRTKYKRVYPGDLTYNMMRAWQGAFGAVRVHGMVSPAYVIAKPKDGVKLDSRYMEALLRTNQATEEMHRYSRGIVDFRLRLYWEEFKNIRVCLPDFEEQSEISDYIDEKSAAMDNLIAKKTALLTELETYKKSLIYEYVTGKKEVG